MLVSTWLQYLQSTKVQKCKSAKVQNVNASVLGPDTATKSKTTSGLAENHFRFSWDLGRRDYIFFMW